MSLFKNRSDVAYGLMREKWFHKYTRKGYKYRLLQPYSVELYGCPASFHSCRLIDVEYATDIRLERIPDTLRAFKLTAAAGYPWDGPSGPTIDTPANVPGSLPHDLGYELMREKLLPQDCREYFDRVALECWRADGFWGAHPWFYGIRWFAWWASKPYKK